MLWELRERLSLLRDHGYDDADLLNSSIGQILDESNIVSTRLNRVMATDALLTRQAIVGSFSEEGAKNFDQQIERFST